MTKKQRRNRPYRGAFPLIPLVGFAVMAMLLSQTLTAAEPAWIGDGAYRIIIKVDPVTLAPGRTTDDMIAKLAINFDDLKTEFGINGQTDLSTLQIHKFHPLTGQPQTYPTFTNARSDYDRPCRFDDSSIPEDYPDRANYPSNYTNGQGPVDYRTRGGRFFNMMAENSAGHLIWLHTQEANTTSYYALYWDTKASIADIGPSPSPLIGDADILRVEDGESLIGMAQLRLTAADFNGDGLFDIIAGDGKGNILICPNMGTQYYPRFLGCRPVMDESGPINVGYYAAPFVYDWNNDGLLDLLVGTSHNVILWWKNTAPTEPALIYQGFIQADGARLETPQTPCAEDPDQSIWKSDYSTSPCVCDWNNDGLPDIITGGYITGQIAYYRCTGRDASGVPILTYEGLLEADGTTLDTVWCATPFAYDFDNDGKLELITGSVNYGGEVINNDFLMYYKNIGTAEEPVLSRRFFPRQGDFPRANMGRAAMADWNGDGKPDLLVSNGRGPIYVYKNIGTANSPTWQIDNNELTCKWGFWYGAFGSVMSLMDIDNDNHVEVLSGSTIIRVQGSPHSPEEVNLGRACIDGNPIWHPGPGYGDGYNYNIFADWDLDGKVDILSGTQQGNIYFHKNLGSMDNLSYAEGILMTLTNGEPLKVGPDVYENPDDVPDFQTLQGSRIKMVFDDVDKDGIGDLVIVETYGNIWVFRNTVAGSLDQIEPGVLVGNGVSRFPVAKFDWNLDGKNDLICGLPIDSPGNVYVNQSTIAAPAFDPAIQPLGLPFMFYNVAFNSVDWNHDGDEDFFTIGEYYRLLIEDSFIKHGYIEAQRYGMLKIEESDNSTEVNEAGPSNDTYTISLWEQPEENVTINISTDGQTTVEPATVIFQPQQWQENRLVTVTAVDDDTYESFLPAVHSGAITHITNGGSGGQTTEYLYVDIIDNDRQCGDPATTYRPEDFNQDCYVNIADFARLATHWLACNDPQRPDLCVF